MMATEDFFEFSGSNSPVKSYDIQESFRSVSDADTEELMRGFKEHAAVSQTEHPESDFFKRDDGSSEGSVVSNHRSRLTETQSTPQQREVCEDEAFSVDVRHPSKIGPRGLEDTESDFFRVAERLSQNSRSSSESSNGQILRPQFKSSSSDIFTRDENVARETDRVASVAESQNSNFFQPDDIDETSRSTKTPLLTDRSAVSDNGFTSVSQSVQRPKSISSESKLMPNVVMDTDSETERAELSEATDVGKTEWFDELEANLSLLEKPENIQNATHVQSEVTNSDFTDTDIKGRSVVNQGFHKTTIEENESGWSTIDTPSSDFLRPADNSSEGTAISSPTEFMASERSDVTLTPESEKCEPLKPVTHKSALLDSDIARKYTAYQKQRETSNGTGLKSDFVNDMLSRAQERQSRQSCSTDSRPSSASNYPKGVVLSKTFTKNTRKTFQAWAAANEPGNQRDLQHGDDLNVVSSPPPLMSPPGIASVPEWKVHQPSGYDRPIRNGSYGNSERSSSRSKMAPSPAIVDESYYQSILQTTPLSNPTTPAMTERSDAQRNVLNNRKVSSKLHQPKTKARPSSAQKGRSAVTETQNKSQIDNNAGFTVVGKRQEVGQKRPKSTYGRYRSDHKPSYVDELLFGKPACEPDFPSPFGITDSKTKPLPFVAIASIEPPQRQTLDKKQPGAFSRSPNPTQQPTGNTQTSKHRGKQSFSNTYVDEGLFGPKPEEPSFKAPWDKREGRKPYVFDGTNYKANRTNRISQSKRENTESAAKKPVWR